MSEEELNKKMEFIVEQQAQFTADIQAMREVQAANEKQMGTLSQALIAVVASIGDLAQAQKRTDERIGLLTESIKLLAEAQSRTDERLNNLINIVERHISGNGGPHSHA